MIEILPAPDHVVAMRVSGTLTGDDIERVTLVLEAALSRHQHIALYADMVDFADMTAEALLKDLRYGISKIGQWSRFGRAAVVSDREWLRAIARLENHVIPGIDIRAFGKNEREAALAWASGEPVPQHSKAPASADTSDPGEV